MSTGSVTNLGGVGYTVALETRVDPERLKLLVQYLTQLSVVTEKGLPGLGKISSQFGALASSAPNAAKGIATVTKELHQQDSVIAAAIRRYADLQRAQYAVQAIAVPFARGPQQMAMPFAGGSANWAEIANQQAAAAVREQASVFQRLAAAEAQRKATGGQFGRGAAFGILPSDIARRAGDEEYARGFHARVAAQDFARRADTARGLVLLSETQRRNVAIQKEAAAADAVRIKRLQELGYMAKDTATNFGELSSSLGIAKNALMAMGIGAATRQLGEFVKESTLLAGRVENLGTVLGGLGSNIGYSRGELASFEESTKKLGITTRAAREALAVMARNQLDLAKTTDLARLAQDSAVIAGLNSSEAFEKMIIAIQRLDTRMFRTQGIVLNLRNIYEVFRAETGRVADTLTAHEKQVLLMNAALETGASIAGTYELAMTDAYKRFTSLVRLTEEARREFGEQFLPVFRVVIQAFEEALTSFIHWNDGWQGFVAGVAGGILTLGTVATALYSLKTAIVAVRWAMAAASVETTGFIGALMNLPVLTVAGVLAGIGAAIVYASSQAEAAKKRLEEAETRGLVAGAREIEMARAVGQVERLVRAQDGSVESTNKLRSAMSQLTELTGEHEAGLRKLTNAYELLDAVRSKFPELQQSYERRKLILEGQIKTAKFQLAEAQKEILETQQGWHLAVPGTGGRTPEQWILGIQSAQEREQQAKEDLKQAEAHLKSLNDTREAYERRELEALAEKQNTTYEMAQRFQQKLRHQKEEAYRGTVVETMREFENQRQQLSAVIMSEEKNARLADKQRQDLLRRIEEAAELERTRAKTAEERAAVETKRLRQREEAEVKVGRDREQRAERSKKSEEALARLPVELARTREKIEQDITRDRAKRLALEIGETSEAISIQDERLKEQARYEAGLEEQRRLGGEIEEELRAKRSKASVGDIADLQELRQAEVAYAAHQRSWWTEEQRHLEEMARLNQKAINQRKKEIEDQERDADRALDARRKLADEIATLEGRETAVTAEEAAKRIRERHREGQAVEDFIRRARAGFAAVALPGVEDLSKVYQEYSENVSRAQTMGQLRDLGTLFPRAAAKVFDEATKGAEDRKRAVAEINKSISAKRAAARQRALVEGPSALVGFYSDTAEERSRLASLAADQAKYQAQTFQHRDLLEMARGALSRDIAERAARLREVDKQKRDELTILQQGIQLKKDDLILEDKKLQKALQLLDAREEALKVELRQNALAKESAAKTPEDRREAWEAWTKLKDEETRFAQARQRLAREDAEFRRAVGGVGLGVPVSGQPQGGMGLGAAGLRQRAQAAQVFGRGGLAGQVAGPGAQAGGAEVGAGQPSDFGPRARSALMIGPYPMFGTAHEKEVWRRKRADETAEQWETRTAEARKSQMEDSALRIMQNRSFGFNRRGALRQLSQEERGRAFRHRREALRFRRQEDRWRRREQFQIYGRTGSDLYVPPPPVPGELGRDLFPPPTVKGEEAERKALRDQLRNDQAVDKAVENIDKLAGLHQKAVDNTTKLAKALEKFEGSARKDGTECEQILAGLA